METQNNTIQTEMKFCKHCGQQIEKDVVVCTHCGKQVEVLEQAAAQPQVVINNSNMNTNTNTNTNINANVNGFIGVIIDLIVILTKPNPYYV